MDNPANYTPEAAAFVWDRLKPHQRKEALSVGPAKHHQVWMCEGVATKVGDLRKHGEVRHG